MTDTPTPEIQEEAAPLPVLQTNIEQSPQNPDQQQVRLKIEISQAELAQRSLFVAVPMYGGICSGLFNQSMNNLVQECTRIGVKIVIYNLTNESLITRARNYCADEFMRSGCSHLMFIDSDIGFNPRDVLALLALAGDESPYDVIGGPYPKKTIAWEKIRMAVDKGLAEQDPNVLGNFVGDYVFNPRAGTNAIPLFEPAEVLEIGTGFMMIRRKTLEKFAEAYPHLWYRPDHVRTKEFDGSRKIMAFFDCVIDRGYNMQRLWNLLQAVSEGVEGVENEAKALLALEEKSTLRYLSEDYKFCQDVINAGMHVWLCPWMKLQHAGTFIFGGSLLDIAALGASATVDPNQLKHVQEKQAAGAPVPQPAVKPAQEPCILLDPTKQKKPKKKG